MSLLYSVFISLSLSAPSPPSTFTVKASSPYSLLRFSISENFSLYSSEMASSGVMSICSTRL